MITPERKKQIEETVRAGKTGNVQNIQVELLLEIIELLRKINLKK
jgi:hypothetical protein